MASIWDHSPLDTQSMFKTRALMRVLMKAVAGDTLVEDTGLRVSQRNADARDST